MPPERMLRSHFMEHWFNFTGPEMEGARHESESMQRSGGIELAKDVVPGETTILRLRHLLERQYLSEVVLARNRTLPEGTRLLRRQEREVCGDRVDWNAIHRQCARASGLRCRVNPSATHARLLVDCQHRNNRYRPGARVCGENALHIVGRLRGFAKVHHLRLDKSNVAYTPPLRRSVIIEATVSLSDLCGSACTEIRWAR